MKTPRQASRGNSRPLSWRRAVAMALHELKHEGVLEGATVVLIGSYAHGTPTRRSDIDLLVLAPSGCDRRKIVAPETIHLQYQDIARFKERAERGDDYALAALRFGRVLYDRSRRWSALRNEFGERRWPDWRDKMKYAARRLRFGDTLFEAGDVDAASEEYLLAATQIARAVLFRTGIYPLSRPQLASQLEDAGETRLAEILVSLLSERPADNLRALSSHLREMVGSSSAS